MTCISVKIRPRIAWTSAPLFAIFAFCSLGSASVEAPQHARQAGPLLVTAVKAQFSHWDAMSADNGAGNLTARSVAGWGVTVVIKNTTNAPAIATIDPAALRIADAEGKLCGQHPADADIIAHAILEPLGSVNFTNTWGWNGESAIVRTFRTGASTVLRLVLMGKGTLIEFVDRKGSLGTLMTGDQWELKIAPQKSVTVALVFDAPMERKPATLNWPGADPIDLP